MTIDTAPPTLDADEYLDALADRIRVEYRRGKAAAVDIIDASFAIGRCLLEAREALPSNQAFGQWTRAEKFEFTRQWAHKLQQAAKYEAAVRDALSSQLDNGQAPNLDKAIKQVTAALGGGRDGQPVLTTAAGLFSAVVIDPPWRYDNVATRGAAEDHYRTMSLEDLAEMDLPAAPDAHLYLWVTNSFIREGFALMDGWDFEYKTCLTWCKPQIGMGNYFRSSTEHVLFGMRGRLPTLRNNVPTHFVADRTRHSQKPESFYDLVEACSPGPWLEMFARRPALRVARVGKRSMKPIDRLSEGYEPRFDVDAEVGHQGELVVTDLIGTLKSGRAEVKTDEVAAQTGRFYIETECLKRGAWHPSGINVTAADVWVQVVGGANVAVAVPVGILRSAVEEWERTAGLRDCPRGSHPTRGVAIPPMFLIRWAAKNWPAESERQGLPARACHPINGV